MAKAEIQINNKRYSIACAPGQEDRVAQLSQKLDRRVRTIADAVGDLGEARLLLIAALALLDEAGDPNALMPIEIEQKAATALQNAAGRIEALARNLSSPESDN